MCKLVSWTVRYQKLRELGKGGNARVYLVKRSDRSEEYALKTLNARGAEKQSRFIDEIHVMRDNYATIEGILPVFDYSEADFWYTMPVAEPVMNYIERNRSSIKSIVLYSISLCDTLIELHRRGISHRDIKPSNIYFYEGRFYLGDFGLVDFPDNTSGLTKENKGLGAIFTIAPEMKRNPKNADGEKADVFSFAKTMWMFLTGNEKGFDGVYNYSDPNCGLSYVEKYHETHLVELEELFQDATSNNPDDRPSMEEFEKRLTGWIEIYSDINKSQASDWSFLNKQLFRGAVPTRTTWSGCRNIIDVLNVVGRTPAYNHLLFSDGGGLDFLYAELAAETDCIKIYDTLETCFIVKPKNLYFEGFSRDYRWNYFLLEFGGLKPVFPDCQCDGEYLIEDTPAHYVSAQFAQYGVYDYDKGIPFPEGYKHVRRIIKGAFLIVMKTGPYNMIEGTYDGRHGACSPDQFRRYVDFLVEKYSTLFERCKSDADFSALSDEEIDHRILSQKLFNVNPFKHKEAIMEESDGSFKENQAAYSFIAENYCRFDFSPLLLQEEPESATTAKFSFKFIPRRASTLSAFSLKSDYLFKDGKIHKEDFSSDTQCYYVYSREIAYGILDLLNRQISELLRANGFQCDFQTESWFSIQINKMGAPTHLFTKEEIAAEMRRADDRVTNRLIIDENGYAKVLQNINRRLSPYPVSHEAWDAGNVYVGKYSKLSTLNDNYIASLQGWLDYLKTGQAQYMDYVRENSDESNLVAEIKSLYSQDKF